MNGHLEASDELGGRLWGVLVTYRRPVAFAETLAKLASQTVLVDHLIIVDNDSDPQVARIARTFGATYVDARANTGPAGGIALGMEAVLERAGDNDWLVLIDDDDPPSHHEVIQQLCTFASSRLRADDRTAAVGLVGARYDPKRGILIRVSDEQLSGPVSVDYIGGNQFPIYRCRVLNEVGVFDRDFFFGFEEAEFGLRLRRSAYRLYVDGDVWREDRQVKGRLDLHRGSLKTGVRSAAWRRYYTIRNAIAIARRYGSPLSPWMVALGGGATGVYSLGRARRPIRELVLPLRAAADGLMGRMGRRVDPGEAKKITD